MMLKEKYEDRHVRERKTKHVLPRRNIKGITALIAVVLVLTMVIGVTVAFLSTKTDPVENKFTPSKVSVEVEEEFDGTVKSNVNVKNTGDIAAYVRVRLVTYRVNDAGDVIGGTAKIPAFTPGSGWVKNGDYYYYTSPVNPGASPAVALIESITLQSYNDADGGKQVIEVLAEGIQADGTDSTGKSAAESAWGVDPSKLS